MKSNWMKAFLISATLAGAVCLTAGRTEASTIYDNTSIPHTGLSFTALQQGDEVHVAGSDRYVTQLSIGVSQQQYSGTASFQARLYANDGAGGQPGSLLWQSAPLLNQHLTGGNDLLTWTLPSVLVPDVFTWTLQGWNESPVAVGLVFYGPPTVGTSPAYSWFGGPGSWTKENDILLGDPMARVIAVPEPSVVALLMGLLSLAAWRRLAAA
jgi:hypothetical protein